MDIDASDFIPLILVLVFVFGISSCSFISASNLLMLEMLNLSKRFSSYGHLDEISVIWSDKV